MSADINFDLLKRLCETPGIPGREEAVRAVVREAMDEIVDEIEVDAMGNLIGRRKGNGGPTVMFAGHMDEIGFMVKHIDDKGFLRLQPVGGFDGRVLPAQRCHVHTEAGAVLPGAMALETKPIHLLSGSDIQAPKVEQIFVDLGLSGDEVKEKVQIGDMVTMDRTVERIGDNVMGKAFDDRISIFLMLEAARLLGDEDVQSEIVLAATTQEEVGLRGARTAAYHVQPDIGVALDITLAMDIPGASPEDAVTRLGDGAAIKVFDSSHISNHKLVSHFKQLAKDNDIKYQLEILPRGGTDAGAMQLSRAGMPVITISLPTRYVHTVNEMAAVSDIQAEIDLLAAYMRNAHEGDYNLA
ncbi:MAG: M42 family metallopeptidase [Thermomicrobiales bacterium]